MKTSIKILLLLLALFVCVAAVLVFQETIARPPLKTKTTDQYEAAMRERIDDFKNVKTDSLEYAYISFLDFAQLLNYEGHLKNDDYLYGVEEFMELYVPKFTDWCFSVFDKSKWPSGDLQFMKVRIQELENYKINGTSLLSNTEKSSLKKVSDVLTEYNDALMLANSPAFTSVAKAQEKLDQAKEYASEPYLRNNTDLVNALTKQFPEKMERAHYRYVLSLVSRMQNYRSYSPEEYEKISTEAIYAKDEYGRVCQRMYGKSPDINSLHKMASDYQDKADAYYEYDYYYQSRIN